MALVASAVVVANRCFLILESPYDFEERRGALQSARENVLAHEEHLRRTGALLTPIDAARQAMQQLTASGLTPDQQILAARISEQLESLSASVESLAPLPKGVSRAASLRSPSAPSPDCLKELAHRIQLLRSPDIYIKHADGICARAETEIHDSDILADHLS